MTAPDLVDEFKDLADRLPAPPPASLEDVRQRAHRRQRGRRLARTGVALAAVIAVTAGVVALRTSTPAPPTILDQSPANVSPRPATDPSALARCPGTQSRGTAAIVDGALSEDPELAEAQRGRARLGLPSDIATVERLLANPKDRYGEMHPPVTADEHAQVVNIEQSRLTGTIYSWGTSQASDVFGGVWIDQVGDVPGGVVTVGFTRDPQLHLAQMRNDLDTEAVISAVNVDHSYQSLRVAQQRIQDEFMLDEQNSDEARVVSLAPDFRISRVKVGITEPDDQLLSAIGDLVDPGLVCWEIAESPTTTKK